MEIIYTLEARVRFNQSIDFLRFQGVPETKIFEIIDAVKERMDRSGKWDVVSKLNVLWTTSVANTAELFVAITKSSIMFKTTVFLSRIFLIPDKILQK